MQSPVPIICKRATASQKIIAHLPITGHGRVMNIPFLNQEVLMEVHFQGIIQGLRQVPVILIVLVQIIHLPGRAIVFQNPGNLKPIQAPIDRVVIPNRHGQHHLIHHPHDLRAVTPLQGLRVAVPAEAGLQVAVRAEAGHPEVEEEAGKHLPFY